MKICAKCQKKFPSTLIINDKRRNFSKRKFCLNCSPFGSHNTKDITKYQNYIFEKNNIQYKKCPLCQLILELNNKNYYMRKSGSFHYYCKKCLNKKSLERKRELKRRAVNYKGGKCIKCGYNNYIGSLDFHHLDSRKKNFSIGDFKTYDWEQIKKEIDKCILLCRNCHGEFHGGIITLENV